MSMMLSRSLAARSKAPLLLRSHVSSALVRYTSSGASSAAAVELGDVGNATPAAPFLEANKKHLGAGIYHYYDDVVVKAKGSYVYTRDGKALLDFTTGFGVTNLGHNHPKVNEAAKRQIDNVVHGQLSIIWNEPAIELAHKLSTITPKGLDTFVFSSSGAEAVENAVKLARQVTKRGNVIVFQGGYHGRTFGAMGMTTSKNSYRLGYGAHLPSVFVSPFPYSTQLEGAAGPDVIPPGLNTNDANKALTEYCIRQFEILLKQQSAPSDTACVLMEPVLGEGGYVPAPKAFVRAVKRICEQHGILFIADEVQSGFGRTGTLFAVEQYGIIPDILVIAKGLGNGFPISGIASRREIMSKQPVGSMGGTYAGHAVSCAAASQVVDIFKNERILDNVAARSKQLVDGLVRLRRMGYPIRDIRGLGLMIGIDFDMTKPVRGDPNGMQGIAMKLHKACEEQGLLLINTSAFEVIRFIPPLTVSDSEMATALRLFENAMESVFGAPPRAH